MSTARRLLLFIAALTLFATCASAASDTSSASTAKNWFGFGDNSKPVKAKKTPARTSKTPQIVTSLTDAPKRLASSTKSMLSTKKPGPVKTTGTTAFYPANKPPEQKQGFFQSLFNPEPPPPPRTIKDWMKLKQIHP